MDRGKLDIEKRIQRIKATIDLFGERTSKGSSTLEKPQTEFSEEV